MANRREIIDKGNIIKEIVSAQCQTGISAELVLEKYFHLEGQELMPTREAALRFLNSIPDIVQNENGLYFCTSQRSAHIRNVILNQCSSRRRPSRRVSSRRRIIINMEIWA